MDRFNPRKVLKTSAIDDGYWRCSLTLYAQFDKAIQADNDTRLIELIENPRLFIGRA